jgi:hypothetical protein
MAVVIHHDGHGSKQKTGWQLPWNQGKRQGSMELDPLYVQAKVDRMGSWTPWTPSQHIWAVSVLDTCEHWSQQGVLGAQAQEGGQHSKPC